MITREEAFRCAQNVGRKMGYAVALHGSTIRDVDLIAVPWIEDCAVTPLMLADAIAHALGGYICGVPLSSPAKPAGAGATYKPHGRIAFAIRFKDRRPLGTFDNWYVDLSVMPRRRKRSAG